MVVLYIDDDPEDIEIFVEALKENNPSVKCLVAQHGRQAMDILKSDFLPDFIFLDINMPVISGKAVLAEIKNDEKLRDIPVVMYSTTINPKEIDEYKSMGANHFLIKHNHFQDLCDSLSSILNGSGQ